MYDSSEEYIEKITGVENKEKIYFELNKHEFEERIKTYGANILLEQENITDLEIENNSYIENTVNLLKNKKHEQISFNKDIKISENLNQLVLFFKNYNDTDKINVLFDEYMTDYKNISMKMDFYYLKYFVEKQKNKENFIKIADKIFKDRFSYTIYSFPYIKYTYFLTAAGCSMYDEKNYLRKYQTKFALEVELLNKKSKKPVVLYFLQNLKNIGLDPKKYKNYSNIQEIIDKYYESWNNNHYPYDSVNSLIK